MKNKYTDLFKNIFIFALGSLGSKLILFLLVPLYTNFMTAEEYGISELVFTVSELLLPFISVTIYDAVIRFGLMKGQKPENVLLSALLVLAAGSVVLLCVAPLIGFYAELSRWNWYLCIYVIVSMFAMVIKNYLKVKDRNRLFAIISVLQTLVLAVLNVLLVAHFRMGVQGYLLSYIVSSMLSIVGMLLTGEIWKALKAAQIEKKLIKKMVLFSAPLILNNISWWLVQSFNKVLVELMLGAAYLGIYTVATKIPSLISVINSVFTQAWGLSAVKEIESTRETDFYGNVLAIYQTVVFGAAVLIISVTKPFMQIYVGEDFRDAWRYVPLLLAGASFSAISTYYGSLYSALKKSVNNMLTAILGALVNVTLCLLLLPRIGLWGAAVATALSYVVIAVSRMFDVQRYMHIRLDLVRFFGNAGLVLLQAVLVSCDFHVYAVSGLSILVFLAINGTAIKSFAVMLIEKLRAGKNRNEK